MHNSLNFSYNNARNLENNKRLGKKTVVFIAKYWRILALIMVLILFFIVTAVFMIDARRTDTIPQPTDYVLVIDAGHGGVDGGVSGSTTGVKESDLNLIYAAELAERFADSGFGVVMTRKDKGGLYGFATKGFKMRDMQKRKEIINDANPLLVVSIHMNRFSASSRKGAQVFFQKGDEAGMRLAECIQEALNNVTGKKYSALSGDFYICRESNSPAVIVECGFLSNKEDEYLLQQEGYRSKIVDAIYEGIMMYFYRFG